MSPRLQRLWVPAKRLGLVAFVLDSAAGCVFLGLQFRAIELGAAPLILGLLGAIPSLAYVPTALASGRVSDRWGRDLAQVLAFTCCLVSWAGLLAAQSTTQLLWLSSLTGVGLGFAWAPLAAWMGDLSRGSPRLLRRYLGYFNLGWSVGLMVGPLLAGALWERQHSLVFAVPAVAAVGCLLVVLLTRQNSAPQSEPTPHEPTGAVPTAGLLLGLTWIGGFAACFGRGVIGAIFPRLGTDLHFSALTIGQVTFAAAAGEFVTFLATRLPRRWEQRSSVQLVAMAASALAMALVAWAYRPVWFGLCFAVIGAALAVTYAAGIQAAVEASGGRGRLAGYQEAVFGAGLVMGPYLGGSVAQWWNLRAAMTLTGAVCALAFLVQAVWWLVRRPRTGSD